MNRKQGIRNLLLIFAIAITVALFFAHRSNRPHQPSPSINSRTALTVSIIDVGQGDSIFLKFPTGDTMLVDAGDSDHGDTVVDYLRQSGVKQIDLLVATHPHEDHIGGMVDVLNAFPVNEVWDSGFNQGSHTQTTFLRTIRSKGIPFETPRAGNTKKFGAASITVLAPIGKLIHGTESDANNNSLVLRIVMNKTSFLLTGDMEKEERQTVGHWPQSTVLKVAHHGSHNGTGAEFINEVHPSLAVTSCGRDNPFGHPHAETLSILRDAGVAFDNTAINGTVVIRSDGQTLQTTTNGSEDTVRVYKADNHPIAVKTTTSLPTNTNHRAYIGNVHSLAFHRSLCSSLPVEQNRRYFETREDAINQGYHPCGRCKP